MQPSSFLNQNQIRKKLGNHTLEYEKSYSSGKANTLSSITTLSSIVLTLMDA